MHAHDITLSAALIVKNEEQSLARCLESLAHGVDEIVVVDTGSTDATRDIARRFTDRLYEFPWRKDFAAARQYSFDQATAEWVFWVDADDVLVNAPQIRAQVTQAASEVKGFYWKYIVGENEYGQSTCELWRERCVRNDRTFRWTGRVHEVLIPVHPVRMLWDEHVTVFHRPPPTRPREPDRNLDILQAEYQAEESQPGPRLLLNLGNEYADRANYSAALHFLQRYLQLSPWDDEKYLAQMKVAALLRVVGRFEEALDAALHGLKTHPDWPNAHFSLAETYYFLREWQKVIYWVESGRKLPLPHTICVVNPLEYTFNWIIHYTNALFHTGRLEEALTWSERALEICPRDPWHSANARFFREIVHG